MTRIHLPVLSVSIGNESVVCSRLFGLHAYRRASRNALVLCMVSFLAGLLPSLVSAQQKPNIIVIYTDDQGWADLGCQGIFEDIRTPHLDALAAGGVRATSGYVTAPQCVPSRAGLMTGRYQPRFGVESNGDKLDGFDAQQTIASRLKKAGYATGMTGKWHLGPPSEIVDHGFDDVFCNQGGGSKAWANFDLDGKTIPGADILSPLYHLDANSAAACAFIKRHKNLPFFFYLAYRAPHVPLDAPKRYLDRFPGKMPERRRQCLAMMSAVDDGVGAVMNTLRECGLEESTLIFYISDNGAPLKIYKEDKPGGGPGWDGSLNEPMNGEKGMLTEGGIREPWIACWKGHIPPGQVFERPVISLDVAATAVALAGLPSDPALDGVNLIPFFTGENEATPHEVLYWRWIAQSAIREGQWKLLVGGSRSYLFDLDADPGEKHNLIAQHPDIARRLRARLEAWAAKLQPSGINIKPMAKTWETYYDFYLDGKPVPKRNTAAGEGTYKGWLIRNGTAQVKDGVLHVTPGGTAKQRVFIACARLNVSGPATATISIRSNFGGKARIAWRLQGQHDFPPGQIVSLDLPASPDWQEVNAELPAQGQIIHVRVLLPEGQSDIRRIELESSKANDAKKWSFESK